MKRIIPATFALALFVASCGNNKNGTDNTDSTATSTMQSTTTTSGTANDGSNGAPAASPAPGNDTSMNGGTMPGDTTGAGAAARKGNPRSNNATGMHNGNGANGPGQ